MGSENLTYSNERGDRHVEWVLGIDSFSYGNFQSLGPEGEDSSGPKVGAFRGWIANALYKMLDKYVTTHYHPNIPNTQQTFKSFYESYYNVSVHGNSPLLKYNIDSLLIDINSSNERWKGGVQDVNIIFNVRLDVENFDDENVDLILFLDNNLDDLRNMATLAYMAQSDWLYKKDPKNEKRYNDLNRVYGKFLQDS